MSKIERKLKEKFNKIQKTMQRRYLQNGKDDVYSMKDRNEKSL